MKVQKRDAGQDLALRENIDPFRGLPCRPITLLPCYATSTPDQPSDDELLSSELSAPAQWFAWASSWRRGLLYSAYLLRQLSLLTKT
jgi:hypothetical protein